MSLSNYLKESGAIDHTIVNFYYSTKQGKGKVIVGGYDQSKVGSEWSVHSDPGTFRVPVTNVTTSGVTTLISATTPLLLTLEPAIAVFPKRP